MLFGVGARPDAAAVRALAQEGGFAVTHEGEDGGKTWLELVINGLAYDLAGLSGGVGGRIAAPRHQFAVDDLAAEAVEAVTLVAGPHLVEGASMMPVVRSQVLLARQLSTLAGLRAIAWNPAQSWMAPDHFVRVVTAWLDGGPFPALGLTGLHPVLDGGLQSQGLAFFTGQELRIEPELAEDRVGATKLAVRLINELVTQNPVDRRHEFAGIDGAPLILEPSSNGRFVRVRAA